MSKRVKFSSENEHPVCALGEVGEELEYEQAASIFQFNNWKLSNGSLDGEAFIYLGLSGHLRVYNPFFTYVIASLKHHFPLSFSPDFHCGKPEPLDSHTRIYIYICIRIRIYAYWLGELFPTPFQVRT